VEVSGLLVSGHWLMAAAEGCAAILNIEQGISNDEVFYPSIFNIL
jgi:hypothetical protein